MAMEQKNNRLKLAHEAHMKKFENSCDKFTKKLPQLVEYLIKNLESSMQRSGAKFEIRLDDLLDRHGLGGINMSDDKLCWSILIALKDKYPDVIYSDFDQEWDTIIKVEWKPEDNVKSRPVSETGITSDAC